MQEGHAVDQEVAVADQQVSDRRHHLARLGAAPAPAVMCQLWFSEQLLFLPLPRNLSCENWWGCGAKVFCIHLKKTIFVEVV